MEEGKGGTGKGGKGKLERVRSPFTRSPFPLFPPFLNIISQLLTSLYTPLTHRGQGKSMLPTAIGVPAEGSEMKLKKGGFLGGFTRFRLMLTLGLAVLLPAAALIYVNFSQLRAFERDKVLQAAIHRDFQEYLAITEKRINKKTYKMLEEARDD